MCPIAAESKNPKSRSKKKINKNIDLNSVKEIEKVGNSEGETNNLKTDERLYNP